MTALLGSEVLKLRTVRSPLMIGIATATLAGLAVAGTIAADVVDPDYRALDLVRAVGFSLFLATLLGILIATNEYRHRTITQTLLTSPKRERVVAAKLAVATAAGIALGVVGTLVMLAVALPWLSSRGNPLTFDGDLAVAIMRLLLAFGLSGALGVVVGLAVRSQVWASAGVFVWFLVVEPLLTLLGFLIDRDDGERTIGPYLPGSALEAITTPNADDLLLSWTQGAFLALGYVAALGSVALALMLRRDAD